MCWQALVCPEHKRVVMSRITRRTVTIFVSVLAMVLAMASTALGTGAAVAAVGPPDPSKVPHYFGPWPNWANSPLTLSKASVTFDTSDGHRGRCRRAGRPRRPTASRPSTSPHPGHDYDPGTTVTIGGGATAATATATVSSIRPWSPASPTCAAGRRLHGLQGGPHAVAAGTGATAIGSGGVDAVDVTDGGSGYTHADRRLRLPRRPERHPGHGPRRLRRDGRRRLLARRRRHRADRPPVIVDDPGSGYTTAPAVAILNGTQSDPINLADGGTAGHGDHHAALSAVNVLDVRHRLHRAPTVTITDPTGTGTGASATAVTDGGAITAVTVDRPRAPATSRRACASSWTTCPALCTPPACPTRVSTSDGHPARRKKYIPTAVPEPRRTTAMADEYVIGLVQYRTSFSSDLPPTLVRGYVQLETPDNAGVSQHFPLDERERRPAPSPTPRC